MPFLPPVPGSSADINRHKHSLPRGWRETRKLPVGTRFQCPGCGDIFVWEYGFGPYGGGPHWNQESSD